MIIKVTYDKETGNLEIDNDIKSILIEKNAIVDTQAELSFEISVDTTQYERDNMFDTLPENII
jgi:hypothetical protein